MQKNNKEKTTGKIKVSEADIKRILKKMKIVSKKKLTIGIVCASVLVAGLGGLAGYFGYKAINNSGNNSSEVIVDPASKDDITVSKFETVDGGDKLGTVTSTKKSITGVKVSIGSNLLIENEDYTAKAINESVSKWEVRIKHSALNKYKGSIVVAPTFDSTPTVEKFTVTFVSDGTTLSTQEIESGKCAVQPVNPTKEGYVFNGWYNGENEFDFKTPITSALTLNAHWDLVPAPIEEVIVTFDSTGGTSVSAQKITKGSTVAKPADPTKDKYKFNGWYDGDVEFDFSTQITSNITLTARWTLPTAVEGLSFYVNQEDNTTCSVYASSPNKLPSKFAIPSTATIDGTEYKVTRLCAPLHNFDVLRGEEGFISKKVISGAFACCANIVEIEIPDTVEFIDYNAFTDCTSLNKVKLTSKCLSIGNNAFDGCSALEEINLEEGLLKIGDYTFRGCSNLKEVVIPDSVKEIGYSCFSDCTSLKTVKLGSNLTSLENSAFSDCNSLESIEIPYSLLSIYGDVFKNDDNLIITFEDDDAKWLDEFGNDVDKNKIKEMLINGDAIFKKAFAKDPENKFAFHKLDKKNNVAAYYYDENGSQLAETVTVPSKVTVKDVDYNVVALSDYCFESANYYDVTNLKKVILPTSIVRIGACAFEDLRNDNGFSVVFENNQTSLKNISNAAFYNSSISSFNSYTIGCINLPEGLINLGNTAFGSCNNITSVNIPSSLEDLKFGYDEINDLYTYPFYECNSLTKIDVSEDNKYYSSDEIGLYETESSTLLQAFGEETEGTVKYTVKEGVKIIGTFAFDNYNAVELTLSSTVKEIDSYCLHNKITTIDLNKNDNFKFDTNNQGFYSKLNKDGDLKLLKIFISEENKGDQFSLDAKTKIIGSRSFYNTNLGTIELNEGLEEIEYCAFVESCCNVASLTIPSSVKSIGAMSFTGLNVNDSITIKSAYVANLTTDLSGVFKNKIKVPTSVTVSESSYLKASGIYEEDKTSEEGFIIYTSNIK